MANLKFLKGNYASLGNAAITEGQILVTKDTRELFVDVDASTRIKIGDFTVIANITALEALDATQVPTSRLYYVEDGNILARSNGTTWIQVNKQKTADELKTFLGLGSMAYKSEVTEGDLNADLKAKVNASAAANHTHDNMTVLNGITAEKVAAWDASEQNAKDYADDLDEAMNTRVEALEAVDHTHTNKELLDTYTQTEANLADAVAKKHSHANAEELDKIVAGDKAKWDAVAADYLDSEDETALKNLIKEAKQAGTDANTNVEAYKVTNDARVKAVEDDIAEIVDGTNGILAQAKTYSDGKLDAAKTAISAEIDADVKVVADDLAGYKTSNDAALAGVKATAEAAATKEYTEAELAKKVDKVEGKSLVSDTEITKLAGVSAGANKVEASENNGNIKIDGVETVVYTHPAKHAIADVDGLGDALAGFQAKGDYAVENHKHVKADITDFAHTHIASEITDLDATIKGYNYATKTEAEGYANAKDEAIAAAQKAADDITAYVGTFTASEGVDTVVKYIDAKTANIASDDRVDGIDERLTQAEKDIDAIEADYLKAADKTELEGKITAEKQRAEGIEGGLRTDVDAIKADYLKAEDKTELSNAITAEKERAEGIEGGLRTDVNTIMGDYLKAADKTELEGKITAEETRAKGVEESLQTQINTIMNNPDAEGAINSINEFTQYVKDHGTIADGFRTDIDKNKEDIAANAKAIEDHETLAGQTYETKTDAAQKLTDAKAYTDAEVAKDRERLAALEAIDHDAYVAADTALKNELSAAIDAAKTEAANQDAVVLAEAQAYADQVQGDAEAKAAELDAALKTELQGEIDADVKVVSDALSQYKIDNDAAVALKANAADVYTKAEVEALMSWGEF